VMELMNSLNKYPVNDAVDRLLVQEALEKAVLMLSPIVPHICHQLWKVLGHDASIANERWPEVDPKAMVADVVQVVVQVNGKLRSRIEVPADANKDALKAAALADENVQRFIGDSELRKVIVVPGKLVNVVI